MTSVVITDLVITPAKNSLSSFLFCSSAASVAPITSCTTLGTNFKLVGMPATFLCGSGSGGPIASSSSSLDLTSLLSFIPEASSNFPKPYPTAIVSPAVSAPFSKAS